MSDNTGTPTAGSWPTTLSGPWQTVLAAAGVGLAGLILAYTDIVTPVPITLTVLALILAGFAIRWRLRHFDEELSVRLDAAGIVLVAGLVVLEAWLVMNTNETWDSMRLLLGVFLLFTLLIAFVILLPWTIRKIALSVLVLLHFAGILTAVTAVQIVGGISAPWLPTETWNRVYRPYLSFFYINNAYHFYSPEPGPPTLLWFRVQFEDGKHTWIKLADRADFPTRLQYQRMLALTESINQHVNISPARLNALWERRIEAGRNHKPEIPHTFDFQTAVQYREPTQLAKECLSSYVRHIARVARHPDGGPAPVRRIKVYRVVHNIIHPTQLVLGWDPRDPRLFHVFFNGEYNTEGVLQGPDPKKTPKLVWQEQVPSGLAVREEPAQDPFLYWMLPVMVAPRDLNRQPRGPKDWIFVDGLTRHAGDAPDAAWLEQIEKVLKGL